MLRWVMITPLGVAVEPEVKTISATSSGLSSAVESGFEQIPPGFPTVGASLTLFLTDGALLGLCSAWAVSSFLPVPRLGLVNPEGYIAFSLFPHLSAISRLAMKKPNIILRPIPLTMSLAAMPDATQTINHVHIRTRAVMHVAAQVTKP